MIGFAFVLVNFSGVIVDTGWLDDVASIGYSFGNENHDPGDAYYFGGR